MRNGPRHVAPRSPETGRSDSAGRAFRSRPLATEFSGEGVGAGCANLVSCVKPLTRRLVRVAAVLDLNNIERTTGQKHADSPIPCPQTPLVRALELLDVA